MSEPLRYLRQNVRFEPLVNDWYAWPHLLAPAAGSLIVANWQTRILSSYVNAPQVHVAALNNPAMRSGPFIALHPSRVSDVRQLLDRTLRQEDHLFRFAQSVRILNEILVAEGKGYSLESLYAKVPPELKGFVELVYDLNNQPSIRFLEGLLYESHYYRREEQTISLSVADNEQRPFLFSTPRVSNESQLRIRMPFDDSRIDDLFRVRISPQRPSAIAEILGLSASDPVIASMFTGEEPPPRTAFAEPGVRIRYFGHACLILETEAVSVLTDPMITDCPVGHPPRFHYADLPARIDHVLLTHAHPDHFCIETLLRLRHRIGSVIVPHSGGGSLADPSLKLLLKNLGFKNVVELTEMERLEIDGGEIIGIPFLGEHADLDIRAKIAHLIRLQGTGVLVAADSCNVENTLYERVREVTGDIDVVFLGMECEGAPLSWLYGALQTRPVDRKMDQSRRLAGSNCRRGLDMIDRLGSKRVYVYAMGLEPWMSFITGLDGESDSLSIRESDSLIAACRERGLTSERLFGQKEILV